LLVAQNNLAITYGKLGRAEEALRMRGDAYSRWLRLKGEEHLYSLEAANNYATALLKLERFEEAKSLLEKTMPVAQRVLGASDTLTFRMSGCYGQSLYSDDGATLGDLREAVETLEDTERTARRVLGGAHPLVGQVERALRQARAAFRTRDA